MSDVEWNGEQWRAAVGFEGVYEVSDYGRVRRVGKAHRSGAGRGGGARIGRVLRDQHGGNDYRVVFLWVGGRQYGRLVHVLVADAFLDPRPSPKHEVNHIDGVKAHNHVHNLEWVTRSENNRHAWRLGLRVAAKTTSKRKPRVTVECACGCGGQVETPDRWGRPRRLVPGHRSRKVAVV